MNAMNAVTWTVEISFDDDDHHTRADAVLRGGPELLQGWGRARKNPADPEVPAIGREVAASRAMADLAHHLLDIAAHRIESWEGRPVHLDH